MTEEEEEREGVRERSILCVFVAKLVVEIWKGRR